MVDQEEQIGTWKSLVAAMSSWRTASVVLLSFSSGLPLGLVWIAIPDWMRSSGVDIRVVGLFTLAQAPWSFKVLWAPLMDRYVPPLLGRRRGWAAITQIALAVLTLGLAGVGDRPETIWVVFSLSLAIAVASASQDIVVDAYAVDVLRDEEKGVAVGARIALYRAAMYVAGGTAISVAAATSWPAVCIGLGLLYLPLLTVTWRAPEPEVPAGQPQSLRDAIWLPFLGFLSRHRALEILAFVLLFKLSDNLAQALLRPFLNDLGYTALDRGVALTTIATAATIGGSFAGGALTNVLGLGRALWVFGLLQIFSNVGYVLLANIPVHRPAMYGAMGFENLCQGLGTGAFSVLLLRMTQRRFSATQYALFSALFGLPRILSGPLAGFSVDAMGWSWFFLLTLPAGIPGLVLLARFVPWGVREPEFEVRDLPADSRPLRRRELIRTGSVWGIAATLLAAVLVAALTALKALRADPANGFDLLFQLGALSQPAGVSGWIQIAGLLCFGVASGLFAAAALAARRGLGRRLVEDESSPHS